MTGRQANTMTRPSLKFINIIQPSDARKRTVRREVRSHVTSRQHHRTRQKLRKEHGQQVQALGADLDPELERQFVQPEHVQDNREEVKYGRRVEGTSVEQDGFCWREPEEDEDQQSMTSSCLSLMANSAPGRAFSVGTMAFRTFALDDTANVVGTTLNSIGSDASAVIQHYDFIVHEQAGDIQQQYSTGTHRSVAHQRFMRFIFDDPVVLTAAMLIGLRCILAPSGQPVSAMDQKHLLQIKSFLIRSINAALDDGKRGLSNQMLICISLLAAYEVKYERRESSQYHLHMHGLAQMIGLRGGLHAIGADTPWVERVLVWQDANSSELAGCEPYCATKRLPSSLRRPKANHEIYTIRKSET